jgi:hypothetical protein
MVCCTTSTLVNTLVQNISPAEPSADSPYGAMILQQDLWIFADETVRTVLSQIGETIGILNMRVKVFTHFVRSLEPCPCAS